MTGKHYIADCPFCGQQMEEDNLKEKYRISDYQNGEYIFWVECHTCGASSRYHSANKTSNRAAKDKARDAWNSRWVGNGIEVQADDSEEETVIKITNRKKK